MSGWKSQHWKKPSLTEEREPNPRTILRLQMLDLFPSGILDILKLHFGDRFDRLDEAERTALAITLSELRLTHGRLLELTNLHPTDVSKTLRGLVANGFLVAEGTGRGTVYRFPGIDVVTPEDVFDASSSVSLPASSVSLVSSSVNLTEQTRTSPITRDENGRLISPHHHLPFVDDLEILSQTELQRLEEIGREPREKRKVDRETLKMAILELCADQFVTLNSLSGLLNRSKSTLRTQYLTQMCRDQELRMAFRDKPNDSRQAYTKA